MSLKDRIAALNAAHVGRIPGELPRSLTPREPPRIPTRRPDLHKAKSFNNPPENVNGSVTEARIGNKPAPPPLPVRRPPPPLPVRKVSQDAERRPSVESIASSVMTTSSTGTKSTANTRANSSERVKAPAWGECELPELPPKGGVAPPKRTYTDERPKYKNRAPSSSASVASTESSQSRRPSQPTLPPRLPARRPESAQTVKVPDVELRKMPPLPSAANLEKVQKSALSWGMNKPKPAQDSSAVVSSPINSQPHPELGRSETLDRFKTSATSFMARALSKPDPTHQSQIQQQQPQETYTNGTCANNEVPAVPASSRPNLSAILATKPKTDYGATHTVTTSSSLGNLCLVCRDFSGPDNHAARYPRQSVRDLQSLAYDLTAPFPSHTDKARAIFTWLHHNIAYDVERFFNGTVQGSTPQSTLQSGLAVCEGYASLFTNLATYAGLESIVISGHGKGYGYSPLAPDSPLPPYNAGHAWNAVRIDDGEWKLIDACWGSGHVQGKGMPYVAKFTPEYFSMTNEEFGIKHFPGNREHFFLPGGRQMSWSEYIQINPANWPAMVEAPTIFTNAKQDYYIGEKTVLPRDRKISVNHGGLMRFQFSLICPHWTLDQHGNQGPAPVFFLMVQGVDGRAKDSVPLKYVQAPAGQGGDTWYLDIDSRQLGAPGQTLTLFAVSRFDNRQGSAARGLTVKQFLDGKGRVAMGFTGVAAWDLVT
jgi:hypothetical protein